MSQRFFRCKLCRMPHEEGTIFCPIVKELIPRSRGVDSLLQLHPEAASRAKSAPPAPPALAAKAAPLAPPRPSVGPPPLPPSASKGPQRGGAAAPRPQVRAQPAGAKPDPRVAPAPARDPLIDAVIDGRYRVRSVLARGGMGVVYEAVHEDLGRRVALKALPPRVADDAGAIARFKNEAKIIAALGHPHIVAVFDFGALPDRSPYLVMEYLEGETLAQRLKRDRALPIGYALEVAAQVLDALAAVHAKNVLHRDLKPENVFLLRAETGKKPAVKLLDFGISKPAPLGGEGTLPDGTSYDSITRTGFVMGTPSYMSYEQARGERDLDARTDVYAVGVLLYEMLLGRLPYATKNPAALVVEMRKAEPVPPRVLRPEVPEAVERALWSMLHWDKSERFASARDALHALTGGAGRAVSGDDDNGDDADPTVVTGTPDAVRTLMAREKERGNAPAPKPPAPKKAPPLPTLSPARKGPTGPVKR